MFCLLPRSKPRIKPRNNPCNNGRPSALMAAMREKRFHMYGAVFHLPMLMRLTRVMSVNG